MTNLDSTFYPNKKKIVHHYNEKIHLIRKRGQEIANIL